MTLFVQLVAHYYIECASVTDPAIKEVNVIMKDWTDTKNINLIGLSSSTNDVSDKVEVIGVMGVSDIITLSWVENEIPASLGFF